LKYFASLTGSRSRRLEADRRRDTFAQQVEAQGKTPKQISTVETITADDEMRTRLALDADAQLGVRRRVMYADAEPVQLGDSYYPLDVVRDSPIMNEADVVQGTDQVLEDLGHTPTRYEDEITWRMPTAAEAQALHIAPGIPVGRLARVTFDQDDP
jgi:GntR family transcriptional regulator